MRFPVGASFLLPAIQPSGGGDLASAAAALPLLDWWADLATVLGSVAAVLVLGFAALQVRQNTKISRGQFWLELEKMLATHDPVHLRLRPGGDWSVPDAGPGTHEEWAQVEDYMGFFEHCELMLRKGLIDRETFDAIFSYRVANILHNQKIVQAKLVEERHGWTTFLALARRLGLEDRLPRA
jgi:hypothetical protein